MRRGPRYSTGWMGELVEGGDGGKGSGGSGPKKTVRQAIWGPRSLT